MTSARHLVFPPAVAHVAALAFWPQPKSVSFDVLCRRSDRRSWVTEQRIIRTVREQIFSSDHIRYLTRRINAALVRHRTSAAQVADERILRDAENEAGNLMAAIRAGAGDIPELVDQLRSAKERLERVTGSAPATAYQASPGPPAAVLRIPGPPPSVARERRGAGQDAPAPTTRPDQTGASRAEDGLYAVISGNVSGMVQLAGVRCDIR